jgi:hypothetical protein
MAQLFLVGRSMAGTGPGFRYTKFGKSPVGDNKGVPNLTKGRSFAAYPSYKFCRAGVTRTTPIGAQP